MLLLISQQFIIIFSILYTRFSLAIITNRPFQFLPFSFLLMLFFSHHPFLYRCLSSSSSWVGVRHFMTAYTINTHDVLIEYKECVEYFGVCRGHGGVNECLMPMALVLKQQKQLFITITLTVLCALQNAPPAVRFDVLKVRPAWQSWGLGDRGVWLVRNRSGAGRRSVRAWWVLSVLPTGRPTAIGVRWIRKPAHLVWHWIPNTSANVWGK